MFRTPEQGTSLLPKIFPVRRIEKVPQFWSTLRPANVRAPGKNYTKHTPWLVFFSFCSNLTGLKLQFNVQNPRTGNFFTTKNFPSTAHRESSPVLVHFATSQRSCPREKLYKTHALVGILLFLFESNRTEAAVQCSEPQNRELLYYQKFSQYGA